MKFRHYTLVTVYTIADPFYMISNADFTLPFNDYEF